MGVIGRIMGVLMSRLLRILIAVFLVIIMGMTIMVMIGARANTGMMRGIGNGHACMM